MVSQSAKEQPLFTWQRSKVSALTLLWQQEVAVARPTPCPPDPNRHSLHWIRPPLSLHVADWSFLQLLYVSVKPSETRNGFKPILLWQMYKIKFIRNDSKVEIKKNVRSRQKKNPKQNTKNQSTSIYTQWTGCLSLPNWSWGKQETGKLQLLARTSSYNPLAALSLKTDLPSYFQAGSLASGSFHNHQKHVDAFNCAELDDTNSHHTHTLINTPTSAESPSVGLTQRANVWTCCTNRFFFFSPIVSSCFGCNQYQNSMINRVVRPRNIMLRLMYKILFTNQPQVFESLMHSQTRLF